jgi:hypothetical protein
MMGDVSRRRHLAGWRRAGITAAAFASAACLLSSCSGEPAAEVGGEPRVEMSTSPRSPTETSPGAEPVPAERGPEPGAAVLPSVPAGEPAKLAGQLDRAVAAVRDGSAEAADVRRAGEFQQLAVHTLADASREFERAVTARVGPQARLVTRPAVRAGRHLDAMGAQQPRLPRWRIIAPPPAEVLLGYYRAAQRRTGVPWTYLAAIHLVETRMGRIRGTSSAGAVGPMQFLPSTWALYGAGGDINDPRDAIPAAARLLKANGAPRDMAEALWHYNPSDRYVRAVSEYAQTMRRSEWVYRAYWHWRVLYKHTRGTYVLPVGYPDTRPVLLAHD